MKILNTGHASYKVTDRKKALDFYCGVLGLKVKFTISYPEYYEFQKNRMLKQNGGELTEENKAWLQHIADMGDQIWITYLETKEGTFLELFNNEGETERYNWDLGHFNHFGYLHLALQVDDIQDAYRVCQEKGVKIINAPNLGIEDAWQFWIEDPDGNSIELMQYEDTAWQIIGHCPER